MSDQASKRQILKSTGILGFAQLLIIIIGIVRVKILAILLGAVGVGIASLFQTTIDLIKSITGFGLGFSAVRDIAASDASEDKRKVASTILVLRKWVWFTGTLGVLTMLVFRNQLSQVAFGNKTYASEIAILSITLLFSAFATGHSAILQGLRRISDMAKANVIGAFLSLLFSGIIYYFFGMGGIVPSILAAFVLTYAVNWYYTRKLHTVNVALSFGEVFHKGKSMASLGFFLSLTSLASVATMYIVRVFILKNDDLGMASVGHFVAAWSISSMYISAIFGAMSADYFPRLSAVQHDSKEMRRLVNAQTEIALLITAPIIIGMVSFIDVVVRIFYSNDFIPAANILDWQLVGDFFKVISWPIGYILIAKGKGKIYIATELFWNVLYCASIYFGWRTFGIQITGIAFLLAYILLVLLYFGIVKSLIRFRWSIKVLKAIAVFLPLLFFSFLSVKYLDFNLRYVMCSVFTLLAIIYSFQQLKTILPIKHLRKRFNFK